jgi:nitrate/nitrite transporter NarK
MTAWLLGVSIVMSTLAVGTSGFAVALPRASRWYQCKAMGIARIGNSVTALAES